MEGKKVFDAEPHKINLLMIRCGELLFPEEKNVTRLVELVAEATGISAEVLTSAVADHLPSPVETGPFFKCPKCNQDLLVVDGLCPDCEASEGGKYRSRMECRGCGYIEKSVKHVVQIYGEFGFNFESGLKKDLGIRTLTDKGFE